VRGSLFIEASLVIGSRVFLTFQGWSRSKVGGGLLSPIFFVRYCRQEYVLLMRRIFGNSGSEWNNGIP
jgi:hypothetical protein